MCEHNVSMDEFCNLCFIACEIEEICKHGVIVYGCLICTPEDHWIEDLLKESVKNNPRPYLKLVYDADKETK